MPTAPRLAVAALACTFSFACLDPGATYEPRSGNWNYEEESTVSNSCDGAIGPSTTAFTFNLDHDDGDEFSIERGEEADITCEIDDTDFTCSAFTVGPNQVDQFDAFITYSVRWSGEFLSATTADGRSTESITCTGDDCMFIPNLPCSIVTTFTAEFIP